MKNVSPVPKARCRSGIGGIILVGNIDAFPGGCSGWFFFLLASLLTLPDTPLMTSLKAWRCECFLHDLALVLPRAFLPGGGLMDGDVPEDNSSFAGASTSSRIMGSFPLLRVLGCSTRSPSCTSFPNLRLFSTWACY